MLKSNYIPLKKVGTAPIGEQQYPIFDECPIEEAELFAPVEYKRTNPQFEPIVSITVEEYNTLT